MCSLCLLGGSHHLPSYETIHRRFQKEKMASHSHPPPSHHPLSDSLTVSLAAGFSVLQAKGNSAASLKTRKPGPNATEGHTDPRMPPPRGMNFDYNFAS